MSTTKVIIFRDRVVYSIIIRTHDGPQNRGLLKKVNTHSVYETTAVEVVADPNPRPIKATLTLTLSQSEQP